MIASAVPCTQAGRTSHGGSAAGLSQLTCGGDSTGGPDGDSRESPESVTPMPPGASLSVSTGAAWPVTGDDMSSGHLEGPVLTG